MNLTHLTMEIMVNKWKQMILNLIKEKHMAMSMWIVYVKYVTSLKTRMYIYIYIHNLHLWTCWVTRSSLVVEPSSTCIWPNKNKAFNQQKTRNHRYLSVWKWQLTHETMVMTRIIRVSKLPTSVELLCSWACDDDPWFETCTHTHIYIYTYIPDFACLSTSI